MMPVLRRFLQAAMLLSSMALAGCVTSLPDRMAPQTVANPGEAYLLEPGNKVRVTVFNETNLSGEFAVDPVGQIALPLVGSVPASGVTAKTLAGRIEAALKRDNLMRDPKVAVEIISFRPYYVLGEVKAPGEFPYTNGVTVLSAVAKAGGYDYRARHGDVVLIRSEEGGTKEYRATEGTPLMPGDIVKVLERMF